ncbi:MAG TPA: hypothetical protein DDZ96_04955 [Porphyromonadaceae bacterium]|jgi:hypothetical protein|uniref:type II toxin-antitoxin system HicA family toxin n=1 Tax=Limibacterium fermenti TaxID=3229863 RepID=UPI000E9C63BB|nr:hypothetical protein [Porphyromonadaceae bacterium]HBL33154.1 hypothetical protein [Porphyromonadaceae bacterium]HBX21120.1 hypothetical protein [Porphyromonadaceae bacterium]HBX47173.1 hypothetical protein [Porphyromonadaceae bacterium]HCM22341.1 hypothetical protein [Porphyromonadaceae bacterium]
MSTKEKLLNRFLSMPKDFTYEEATKLLKDFGYSEVPTGKTGGSRVRFLNKQFPEYPIKFHKPHPENRLKPYVLAIIKTTLIDCGLIDD